MKKITVRTFLMLMTVLLCCVLMFTACLKGEQGLQGAKGDQGIQGDKGDTGAQGIQGEKGDTGEKGQFLSQVLLSPSIANNEHGPS